MPLLSQRTEEETLHWLALRLVTGLGPRKTVELVQRFGSPVSLFRASPAELEGEGLNGALARSMSSGCTFDEAVTQQERLKKAGATLLTFTDPEYPQQLREIYDPPPVLFAQGRLELLETVMIAIVGSRRATPYGVAVAERLGRDLGAAGIGVTSGMARGIDTAAHVGALESGGSTVAVYGCGVDVVYPAENRKLAERIIANGLLVSEFPMGTPAYPQNFPIRNRVVSGLSAGVVVVEGAEYSGSSITARLALDQDREVYAVPGNITSKLSWGPNLLIKQGAHLVQTATDVIDALPWAWGQKLGNRARAETKAGDPASVQQDLPFGPMSGLARQVLSLLKLDGPLTLDCVIEGMADASSSEVIAILFELELAGRVKQLPGKSYVKVWSE